MIVNDSFIDQSVRYSYVATPHEGGLAVRDETPGKYVVHNETVLAGNSRIELATSRRTFLKKGLVAGVGAALVYVAPSFSSVYAKRAYAGITAPIPFVYGDANQDGVFGWDDFDLLYEWVLGPPPPMPERGSPAFVKADVNGDEILDVLDLILFIQRLNGEIDKFPVEE